jgi:energy-coupling factor transporter transmembrane protein EcfT
MWRTAIVTFVTITLFDIGLAAWSGAVTPKLVAESLVANSLGGIILAAILIVIYSLADFLYEHAPTGQLGKAIMSILVLIVAGLFVSALTYYVADLFYNPLPVKFEGYFSSPTSGWYGAKLKENSGKNGEHSFSLIPNKELGAEMNWVSVAPINIKTSDATSDQQYKISIEHFTGACGPEEVKKLNLASSAPVADGIAQASMSFDSGAGGFSTVNDALQMQEFKINIDTNGDTSTGALFSLAQDPKNKNVQITQAVDKKTQVFVSGSNPAQKFLLVSSLRSTSDKRVMSSRTLTVKLDNHYYQFIYKPHEPHKSSGKETCARIAENNITAPKRVGSTITRNIEADDEVVALIKIENIYADSHLGQRQFNYEVNSAGGWITWEGLRSDQLRNQDLGDLRFINMRGNLTDITADGAQVVAKPTNAVSVSGNLNAAFDPEGKIRVSGNARGLWKDNARLNLTKWEKLGWEPKIFILGVAGSFLLLLWPLLGRRLRSDNKFDWMG